MSGILCLKWNNHTSTFIQNLDNLRSKELYCDATLTCCGKYYPAHRFVLTTCSEYFEEIFARAPCKHPFIILKDIDHIQLEALLNYMYKGEVNVLQENLPGLIRAAEALKVKGLAVSEDGNDSKQLKEREAHSSSPNNDKVVSSETKRLHSCVSTDEMETNGNKEINEVEHLNGKSSILPSSVDEDKCMNSSTNDENEEESPDSNKDNDQFNLEDDSIGSSSAMDLVAVIKRKRKHQDVSEDCCCFCQSSAGDLHAASTEGKARTMTVGNERENLGDTYYLDVLERLESHFKDDFNALELVA